MTNLTKEYFDIFKSGKMPDISFLSLLKDNIQTYCTTAIEFGNIPNDTNTSSFVCSFLPLKNRQVSKIIIYLDKHLLQNISYESFMKLLQKISAYLIKVQYQYSEFIKFKGNIDIPMSEMLKKVVEINYGFLRTLIDDEELTDVSKFVSLDKFTEVIESLSENSSEELSLAIEGIKRSNVLPSDSLAVIRKFISVQDTDKNSMQLDKYFDELIRVTTSKRNPYWAKEINEKETFKTDVVSYKEQ